MLWSYEAHNLDERHIVSTILKHTRKPVIVTNLSHKTVGVNTCWINMCKFTVEDAFGENPNILQGHLTNREEAKNFASDICRGRSRFTSLINYKKDGTMFLNHLFGWQFGDLLIAETYMENPMKPT